MAAYSIDLRLRVLRDADAGLPSDELAEKYSVSRAWVDRLKQRRRETGEVAPRKQTRWRTPILQAQPTRMRDHGSSCSLTFVVDQEATALQQTSFSRSVFRRNRACQCRWGVLKGALELKPDSRCQSRSLLA